MSKDGTIQISLAAAGLLETLEGCAYRVAEVAAKLDSESQTELKDVSEQILGIVKILDNEMEPLMTHAKSNLSTRYQSIIAQNGLTGEVIKLRKQNVPVSRISKMLRVSETAVIRFLKYYDHVSPLEKIRLERSSVMNTRDRLEELLSMILRRLHSLEGINDELHVKYIGELRQTLALAAQTAERMATYRKYEEFKIAVWEVLKLELPERRAEIIKKIRLLNEQDGFLPPAP